MKRTFACSLARRLRLDGLPSHQTPTRICGISADPAITMVARRSVGAQCMLRSTRAAEIQQSRLPRFPGRVTRLSTKVSMHRTALAARRFYFSAHEVGHGPIVGV
jgi:hypothetical protein